MSQIQIVVIAISAGIACGSFLTLQVFCAFDLRRRKEIIAAARSDLATCMISRGYFIVETDGVETLYTVTREEASRV